MPLDRFCLVHTHEPEEMRHALQSVYGARSFDLARGEAPFEGRAHHCRLSKADLSYCSYSTAVELCFPEDQWVRQTFCIAGSARIRFDNDEAVIDPTHSTVIPSQSEFQAELGRDYRQLLLRIDNEALTVKLAALLGAPTCALAFEPSAEPDASAVERLRRMTFFLVDEIDTMGPAPQRSILSELEQALMVCFLFGNCHNQTHLLERAVADVAPRQVRLVEDFIAANWDQPITIELLATVAGASARSIFKSFRHSRGHSPMAFVKRVRLDHARVMLLAPNTQTSVTGVALACGFHNLGHFARDYRCCFGELPSETLKRKMR